MLYEILASVTHNSHYLTKYINFISACQKKNENYNGYTEKHHICPKAQDMFPEFTSFREFPWNCVALTPRQHFIAHLLLYKTYPSVISQRQTIYFMISMSSRKINSKLYAKLRMETIETSKGKVTVRDSNGRTSRVSIEDTRYLSGELVHVSKGLISVKDHRGKIFSVRVDDTRYLSGELTSLFIGKVVVKDANGNILHIDNTDTRFLSGELISINKGKVPVIDNIGNTLQVDTTDTRFLSGELVHVAKGKASVKDLKGNTLQVEVTDSRYLSGDLVGATKGRIPVKDAKGKIFLVNTLDARYLSGELVHTLKESVDSSRAITAEQVREIRIAVKNPIKVLTNDFIATRVKKSQKDKIGIIPFERLQYRNGLYLTYESLLATYYADRYKVNRDIIVGIINNKTYKEIII